MKCTHEEFDTAVIVTRVTDDEPGGARISYMASVRIVCTGCRADFIFLGVPAGWSLYRPAVSRDALELRLPIAPQTVKAALA